MLTNHVIGFIGGGQMAEAIFSGMLASGQVKPENFRATVVKETRRAQLEEQYGFPVYLNDGQNKGAQKVIEESDIVVFAVKPQVARSLLANLCGIFRPEQLVISIMGGITLSYLADFFPGNPVLRVMPNTPMLVRKGIAGIAANDLASKEAQELGLEMFNLVGRAYLLPESLIDPLSSVSGCSPAFVYMFIEAMADGGVEKGLPRELALELAAQAVAGSAEMVLQTGKHPAQLKDSVCSPAGSTIVGVHALERGGFRNAVMDAISQSCDRMIEVGKKA